MKTLTCGESSSFEDVIPFVHQKVGKPPEKGLFSVVVRDGFHSMDREKVTTCYSCKKTLSLYKILSLCDIEAC